MSLIDALSDVNSPADQSFPMGKQHKKTIKRSRRKQYLKRKNEQKKASVVRKDSAPAKAVVKKATKKVAKKAAAKKAPAKKAAAKKATKKTATKKTAAKKTAKKAVKKVAAEKPAAEKGEE